MSPPDPEMGIEKKNLGDIFLGFKVHKYTTNNYTKSMKTITINKSRTTDRRRAPSLLIPCSSRNSAPNQANSYAACGRNRPLLAVQIENKSINKHY